MALVTDKPHLVRQSTLIPRDKLEVPVTIIGAGAIGSWVTLLLAKMGVEKLTVFDPDVVAIENVSCQLYGPDDLEKPKVIALKQLVGRMTAARTDTFNHRPEKWTPDPATRGIVICAVDCMETRKAIFEEIVKSHFQVKYFIDTRMGAESAMMYVVNPHNIKDKETYLKSLYSNEDAVQEPCTAKSTGYTASLLSGWAVKAVKDIILGADYPRITHWSIKDSQQNVYKKSLAHGEGNG